MPLSFVFLFKFCSTFSVCVSLPLPGGRTTGSLRWRWCRGKWSFEQQQTEHRDFHSDSSPFSDTNCSMPLAFQLAEEPGPGMGPVVVGRARGNAENLGRLLEGHADEVAQLDQFSFEFALRGKFIQRLVHGEQLLIVNREGKLPLLNIDALLPAPMTHRALAAGVVDQDAAHRLG